MSILKVIVHSLLFMILQPGFLINLYPGDKGFFLSEQTNYVALTLHTFILTFILVSLDEKKVLDTKQNIITQLTQIETRDIIPIVTIVLFVLLSPGLIFTLPSEKSGIFFTKETSFLSVIIHSIIYLFSFGIVVFFLDKYKKDL